MSLYCTLQNTWFLPEENIVENYISQKLHFITYGNENFKHSRKRIMEEAKSLNVFHTMKLYTAKDKVRLYKGTSQQFKNVSSQERGDGYWIWKPLIIQDYLKNIPENDVLFYCDSGSTLTPHSSWKNLINMPNDFVVRCSIHKNFKEVTTGELLDLFPQQPGENTVGAGAACMVVRNNAKGRKIIDAWVKIAKNYPSLFDDHESSIPNPPEFRFNRHDQSVLQRIVNKYGGLIEDTPFYPWFKQQQGFAATKIRY